MSGYRLAIDYGTSNTVAVLRWPDGRIRPLLFDGSPLLPSAVYAAPDGRLLAGRDAERSAGIDPSRLELNPKRLIGEGSVLLGEQSLPLPVVIAATLGRVAAEAIRTAGQPPAEVILTYPAAWAALRRSVLVEAAARAGLPAPTLVPEPVAAAAYFTTVLGHRVTAGQVVVVYDLGAGTLDVSAVRRVPEGFAVLAVDGLPDFGGLDLDAVVVQRVRAVADPATWERLTSPETSSDRRHFRTLWDDARGVKETLSRQPSAGLHLPLDDRDVVIGREEFEAAAKPALVRAAEVTSRVVAEAGVPIAELAGLFLVGGSSRVPLVATTLHQVTGIAPTVLEQPEIVVAEGSLHATVLRNAPPPGAVRPGGGWPATAPGSPVFPSSAAPWPSAAPGSPVFPASAVPSAAPVSPMFPPSAMPSGAGPAGRPGQSAGPPGQTPGRPGQTGGRPGHPAGGPGGPVINQVGGVALSTAPPSGSPGPGPNPAGPGAPKRSWRLPVVLGAVVLVLLVGLSVTAVVLVNHYRTASHQRDASPTPSVVDTGTPTPTVPAVREYEYEVLPKPGTLLKAAEVQRYVNPVKHRKESTLPFASDTIPSYDWTDGRETDPTRGAPWTALSIGINWIPKKGQPGAAADDARQTMEGIRNRGARDVPEISGVDEALRESGYLYLRKSNVIVEITYDLDGRDGPDDKLIAIAKLVAPRLPAP